MSVLASVAVAVAVTVTVTPRLEHHKSQFIHLLLITLPAPRPRHLFQYDLSNMYMEPMHQNKITSLSWPQLPDVNPLSCFYNKCELSRMTYTGCTGCTERVRVVVRWLRVLKLFVSLCTYSIPYAHFREPIATPPPAHMMHGVTAIPNEFAPTGIINTYRNSNKQALKYLMLSASLGHVPSMVQRGLLHMCPKQGKHPRKLTLENLWISKLKFIKFK